MTYTKPLPIVDGDSAPFWAAAREGRLAIPRCEDCGRYHFYPRVLCPHCHSDRVAFHDVSGEGCIYSFTVHHRAAGPAFESDLPYVVALVDLDEGVRMLTNIVPGPIERVKIGARVRVRFDHATDEITLPKFDVLP